MMEYKAHMAEARDISNQIYACHQCGLGANTTRVPFGGVTWAPDLILLGEAPGATEEAEGAPFLGRAGKLLDEMLEAAGGNRARTMTMNTVCCRPPANRDPKWGEIQACAVNRNTQIRLGRTWVGVTLGRVPLSVIMDRPEVTIGPHKGLPFWKDLMVWVPTYHPAYALRTKSAVPIITAHLKLALDILHGVKEPPVVHSKEWTMKRGCLILDSEASNPPDKIKELAQATFTKLEWAKIQYSKDEVLRAAIEVKKQIGALVVS